MEIAYNDHRLCDVTGPCSAMYSVNYLHVSRVLSSHLAAARAVQSRKILPELRRQILEHDLDQSVEVVLVSPAPVLACAAVVEHHRPRVGCIHGEPETVCIQQP